MIKNLINKIKKERKRRMENKKSIEPTNINYFWNFMYKKNKAYYLKICSLMWNAIKQRKHYNAHVNLAFNSIGENKVKSVLLSVIAEQSTSLTRKYTKPLIEDLNIDIDCIMAIKKEIFIEQVYLLQQNYYYNMLLEDNYIYAWEVMLEDYIKMNIKMDYKLDLKLTPEILQDIKYIAKNIIYEKNMPLYGEDLYQRGCEIAEEYCKFIKIYNENGELIPQNKMSLEELQTPLYSLYEKLYIDDYFNVILNNSNTIYILGSLILGLLGIIIFIKKKKRK